MATYYVSKSGNDNNEGTSEALAWLTVTKAFQTLQAGDTCYIAPGTYRERVIMSNAGTLGSIILIIGDPDCEHFINENKGTVRITGADTSEVAPSTAGNVINCEKDYVTVRNLVIDGSPYDEAAIRRGSGTQYGRNTEYCVCSGYYGVQYGVIDHCLCIGRYAAYYAKTIKDSICIGDYVVYVADEVYNTISAGRYAFYDANAYNCMAFASTQGFQNSSSRTGIIAKNCFSFSCNYGFNGYNSVTNYLTTVNCYSQFCYNAYYNCSLTDCKYSTCHSPGVGLTGTPTEGAILSWAFQSFDKLREALKPWMFEGAKQWGTTSGITVPDTDILGLPRQMIGGGLDIGPYAYSIEEADWSTYSTDAPSIKISQKGAKVFKLPAEVGTAITITCKCKHQNTSGDKPQLILKGESISEQTDTCINDTDTWDTLTVSATPTKDEELEVILYARDTGSIAVAYFSDIEVS